MKHFSLPLILLTGSVLVGSIVGYTTRGRGEKARLNTLFNPVIPRTWDSLAMADTELPLATARAAPHRLPARYYYARPGRLTYQTYPVSRPAASPLATSSGCGSRCPK
ncbi:MAG: hypothetical protein EOO62_35185 [Hymenobacter sp.]|nr:MAG: hypothetical protein EOO62_35185 [Hymenobacter sp.]